MHSHEKVARGEVRERERELSEIARLSKGHRAAESDVELKL